MMNRTLQDKVLAYLENHHVMTLATIGAEGVWATAVFYVNNQFTLYFLSAPTTRHSQNIATQSTIAVTIQEDYKDWEIIKGIQLEGTAQPITGAEQITAIAQYSVKFPIIQQSKENPSEIAKAMSKVSWYKVVPHRLYFIDNSLGLGHRDELPLNRNPL